MTRKRLISAALPCLLATIAAGLALAQPGWGGRSYRGGGMVDGRAGVPDWEVDERFPKDVFTFVRVQYDSGGGGYGGYRRGRGGGGRWMTDYPDSDLNFSYRLQQLTALKVNPEPIYLRVTDPKVNDYPFLYMIEPGDLSFSEEEVVALRRYLLNGGFLMVDDFWGDWAWENFHRQIKRVFPEREPVELSLDHEIFRCVYPIKEKPQVPSIHSWDPGNPTVTWEHHDGNTREVHYKAIFDDKGRMMAILCHNTDLGDGWEREGENYEYFKEFSEKKSYPMGINIITYAMTH